MSECNVLQRRDRSTLGKMLEFCNFLEEQKRRLMKRREEGDKIAKTVDQLTSPEELEKAVQMEKANTDRQPAEIAVLVNGDTSTQFIGGTSTQLIGHTSTQLIGDISPSL